MNEPTLATRLARAIDHTLLAVDATENSIDRLCDEAVEHGFAAVCINPTWVGRARSRLPDHVAVATVIGFPLGANSTETKVNEAHLAVDDGADELDLVMAVGRFLSGDDAMVGAEISAVTAVGAPTKVILETAVLSDERKIVAAGLAVEAGATFVKTSTGFGPGGATVDDVSLLRRSVPAEVSVKASGGIRDLATARAMLDAGADRLGTSASVAIVEGLADEP